MSAKLFPSPLRGEGARRAGEGGAGEAGHTEHSKAHPLPNPSPLKGEGLNNKEHTA